LSAAADRLKSLNVAALNTQGQPVVGLRSADFQLSIDGKPQSIVFSRFTGDRSMPAPELNSHEASNRNVRRATVLLLDLLNDRVLSDVEIVDDTIRAINKLTSTGDLYVYI